MSTNYPPDWDSRRKRVYRRDNFTCQNCGSQGGPKGDAELHAHHIVPKAKGGSHNVSNLKTICKDCHNAIHGNSMAPTHDENPNSSLLNKERLITRGVFRKCPICDSPDIGVGSDEMEIYCNNCRLELERVSNGLEVKNIDEDMIEDGSLLKQTSEYILAEPAWLLLADNERGAEFDFNDLRRRSRKYQKNMENFRKSKLPPIILIFLFSAIFALFNLLMSPILALGGVFVLLLTFAFSFPKLDPYLKKLVFRLSD